MDFVSPDSGAPFPGNETFSGQVGASGRTAFLAQDSLAVGRWAEDLAADLLAEEGYSVCGRNVRVGPCELDLIGFIDGCLTVVEVRCRQKSRLQSPEETVGPRKWNALVRGIRGYASQTGWNGPMRIDLFAVTVCGRRWSARWYKDVEMGVADCGR
ncbi:putative endonuclease related to Holliday junction resolvase [Jonquetella anthropi DSM 22815]|uniref:Putative endonuclease related to Holliday junction resolvase n=1 Tax=Jonquetella anthropi DSM 22815 TaxID=885272 RepID=H0UMI6_9BACT|nr:YraN family protein [Jonquetella anthropi]EHM13689.1 putative endonuclease related to Holliday junction resolvase [Jonquetella anthropi DSM 22815]